MKKTLLIALWTLGYPGLRAQVLPLDSVLQAIDDHHPELKMYDAQIRALDAYATGARSWMPPRVGAGFFMKPYNPRSEFLDDMMDQGSRMLSVEQMIPNPAKQRANRNYMQSMTGVERENRSYQRNGLRARAKMNYYEWVVLNQKRRVLKQTEDLLRFVIKSTEIRYPYSGEKLSDVYRAKASLYRLQNTQLINDNEINEKRIALNTLMNRPNVVFDVDTTYALPNYDLAADADTGAIAGYRSDIRSLDRSIQRTGLKQQLESSSRKPEFGIQYQHMNPVSGMPNQFTLMGMVSVPIAPWSAKMYRANVVGLSHEAQALRSQREGRVNEVAGMLQILRGRMTAKKAQWENYEQHLLPTLEKAYRTTLLAYEQNTEELSTVLDAWESLRMARLEALDGLRELLQLQVDYEKETEK